MTTASTGQRAALTDVATYAATELAPLAEAIDREGRYPEAFLTGLGTRGGFGAERGAGPVSLLRQLQTIATVGRYCGSTAFLAWCQSASAWYLQRAPRSAVRERYLAQVLDGSLLAGSGMSNALKHFAGIEKIRLHARADAGGYVVDGVLPWVSNLDRGHLLLTAAAVGDAGYAMLAVRTDADGVELHPCPDFAGMAGTQTWNVRLRGAHVSAADVLAGPQEFEAYLRTIQPCLVLTQVGFGLGVIAGSADILQQADTLHSAVNQYLADGVSTVRDSLEELRREAESLARRADAGPVPLLPVLRLRARTSEWALRAAQSAMLHVGARGYLLRHPAQRRMREAVFVAIVTPALKHLRKEIGRLELEERAAEAA